MDNHDNAEAEADRRRAPADRLGMDVSPGAALMPLPPPSDAPFVCTLGPCRHYWEMTYPMPHVAGTFGPDGLRDPDTGAELPEPRHIVRTCLVHAGVETELSADEQVSHCNRWDGLSDNEYADRARNEERLARFISAARLINRNPPPKR